MGWEGEQTLNRDVPSCHIRMFGMKEESKKVKN
jgi:hypothetical protein